MTVPALYDPSGRGLGMNVSHYGGEKGTEGLIVVDGGNPTGYAVGIANAVKIYGQFNRVRVMNWTGQVTAKDLNRTWDTRINDELDQGGGSWSDVQDKWGSTGLPILAMIQFANEIGKPLCWTFPQQCDTDFMRQAGVMFATYYEPNELIVEGPNEIWNGTRGWYYIEQAGAGNWPEVFRLYARDCAVKWAAFIEGFESVRTNCTIRRFIGGQIASIGVLSSNILKHLSNSEFDGFLVAAYFGDDPDYPGQYNSGNCRGFPGYNSSNPSHCGYFAASMQFILDHKALADSKGCEMGIYEGGPTINYEQYGFSLLDSQDVSNKTVQIYDRCVALNCDPMFYYSGVGKRYDSSANSQHYANNWPVYNNVTYLEQGTKVSAMQFPTLATYGTAVDTTPPTLDTAVLGGAGYNEITLTFDEAVTYVGASGFALFSSGSPINITGVSGSGDTMVLTLDRNVYQNETVTLDYTAISGTVKDLTGNKLADISGDAVDVSAGDTEVAPVLVKATPINYSTAGTGLLLAFSEDMDATTFTGFTLTINGTPHTLTGTPDVLKNKILWNIAGMTGNPVLHKYDVATVDYTPGNVVDDTDGTALASIAAFPVTVTEGVPAVGIESDTDGPVITSAAVSNLSPKKILIEFDEDVFAGSPEYVNSFSLSSDYKPAIITVAELSANTATLTLSRSITNTETLTLDYTAGSLRDQYENLVPSVADEAVVVTNGVTLDTVLPEIQGAAVAEDGVTITLAFSESMVNSTGFAMSVNGSPATLTLVEVQGVHIVFTSGTQIYRNSVATITYTPGNVTDVVGNALAAIPNTAVDTDNAPVETSFDGFVFPRGPIGYAAPAEGSSPPWSGATDGTAVFGERVKRVSPGETFVATGAGLSGSTMLVWHGSASGTYTPDKLDDDKLEWYVPTTIAHKGVMVLWPKDGSGDYGPPVRVNAPENVWCDTHEVVGGIKDRSIRLYGCNMLVPGRTPVVVAQSSGGETTYELTVTAKKKAYLDCRIPDNFGPGAFRVWVHNGSGGDLGWSESDDLLYAVAAPSPIATTLTVSAMTEAALLSAIAAVPETGAVIQLLAGEMELTTMESTSLPSDRPIVIVGTGTEGWNTSTEAFGSANGGSVIKLSQAASEDQCPLVFRSDRCKLLNLSVHLSSHGEGGNAFAVAVQGSHFEAYGCNFGCSYKDAASWLVFFGKNTAITGSIAAPVNLDADIHGCEFYGFYGVYNHGNGSKYVRSRSNTFYMAYNGKLDGTGGNAVSDYGSRNTNHSGNIFRPVDKANGKIMNRAFLMYSCRGRNVAVSENSILGGGAVNETYEPLDITAITQANPGEVTTSSPHGLVTGRFVYIDSVAGMTEVNGNRFTVTVVDETKFTIGVNTTGYTAYSSGGEAHYQIDYDQGEQILFHQALASPEIFTVVSATESEIVVSEEPVSIDGLFGEPLSEFMVYVANGLGVSQVRRIASYEATSDPTYTLVLQDPLRLVPEANDVLFVLRAFKGCVVYGNTVDPSDSGSLTEESGYQTVGVLLYQAVFDLFVADNVIRNCSYGLAVRCNEPAYKSPEDGGPAAWNVFEANAVNDLYDWGNAIGGAPSAAIGLTTWANSQAQMDAIANWIAVGNVFRGTRIDGVEGGWALQFGWERKANPASNGWSFTKGDDKGFFLNVVEGSSLRNCVSLLTISPPTNWSVIRNNSGGDWTNDLPVAIEQLDSGDIAENVIQHPLALTNSGETVPLQVSPFMTDLFGPSLIAWFPLSINEAGDGFPDIVGGLEIGYTSGITTGAASGIVGDTGGESVVGSATVVTTISGDLPLLGTDLQGPWGVACLYKYSGTPGSSLALWAMGYPASSSKSCYVWSDATNLGFTTDGGGSNIIIAHATSGINDGNWHLIGINYENVGTNRINFSIDGAVFAPAAQPTRAVDGTPDNRGINILRDVNGNRDGNGVGLDELLVVSRFITDEEIAAIHNALLVEGFVSPGVPETRSISISISISL